MHLIERYGYGAVALAVGVESVGVPVPGETMLLAAAIYAGTSQRLSIAGVIAAAALGAIMGDNIGFWIGRAFGYRLLLRYGSYVRLTEARLKLGQYLFLRHGGKVVFLGRFVAVLRALAALLAGANRMAWPRFLAFNATGGIVWAAAYGVGAYLLGTQVHRVLGPVGIALLATVAVLMIVGVLVLRRHEARLEEEAERALPGPLLPVRRRR
jgi:membrane protein DedA with SNARE-associated domain